MLLCTHRVSDRVSSVDVLVQVSVIGILHSVEEYAKWWKPSGAVPLLPKTEYKWPTHIVYDFPKDSTKDPRVVQIQDAPDPVETPSELAR